MRIQSEEITLMPDEAAELFTTFVADDTRRTLADQILLARAEAVIEHGEGDSMEPIWSESAIDWRYAGIARRLAYCAQSEMLEPLERQVLKNFGVSGLSKGDEAHVDYLPHTVSIPNEPDIYKSIFHAAKGFADEAIEIERAAHSYRRPTDLPEGVAWIFGNRKHTEATDQTQEAARLARATRLQLLSRTILGAYAEDYDAAAPSSTE